MDAEKVIWKKHSGCWEIYGKPRIDEAVKEKVYFAEEKTCQISCGHYCKGLVASSYLRPYFITLNLGHSSWI